MGDEILRKLDYDCDKLLIDRSTIVTVAHRSKKLDEVAQNSISHHPDDVGLPTAVFATAVRALSAVGLPPDRRVVWEKTAPERDMAL
jgi:hypothetical protein